MPKVNYQWKIECFLEDLFLGGQSSIILGYRRLSVKFLPEVVSNKILFPICQHMPTIQTIRPGQDYDSYFVSFLQHLQHMPTIQTMKR